MKELKSDDRWKWINNMGEIKEFCEILSVVNSGVAKCKVLKASYSGKNYLNEIHTFGFAGLSDNWFHLPGQERE